VEKMPGTAVFCQNLTIFHATILSRHGQIRRHEAVCSHI